MKLQQTITSKDYLSLPALGPFILAALLSLSFSATPKIDLIESVKLFNFHIASILRSINKGDFTVPEFNIVTTSYSFSKTQGFLENGKHQYVHEHTEEQLESKILETIPGSLRRKAKPYIRPILKISEKYQVDPFWIVSIIWTESHFKSHAKSRTGARGLMQIMPRTQKYLAKILRKKKVKLEASKPMRQIRDILAAGTHLNKKLVKNLENIELGVYYLKRLLILFKHNHTYATVAYNMGPTWTRRRLRKKLPVGNRNLYVNKVVRAYSHINKKIQL